MKHKPLVLVPVVAAIGYLCLLHVLGAYFLGQALVFPVFVAFGWGRHFGLPNFFDVDTPGPLAAVLRAAAFGVLCLCVFVPFHAYRQTKDPMLRDLGIGFLVVLLVVLGSFAIMCLGMTGFTD